MTQNKKYILKNQRTKDRIHKYRLWFSPKPDVYVIRPKDRDELKGRKSVSAAA